MKRNYFDNGHFSANRDGIEKTDNGNACDETIGYIQIVDEYEQLD